MTALWPLTVTAESPLPPVEQLPKRLALPDPLVMMDGTRITTPDQWRNQRRPELIRLLEHYMYGKAPPAPKLEFSILTAGTPVLDGLATLKEIEIRFPELPESAPKIHLALFIPTAAKKPVPVFVGINACGNAEVVADEAVRYDSEIWVRDRCAGRGSKIDFWCVELLMKRGYAFATFHESDLDPDRPNFEDGIHPFFPELNKSDSRWGTIAAWAWGFQRVVDYLVTDREIDEKRICLIGHSRRGKTALWAAALDERVALVVPHQSGTGGMALSRDSEQETVERINRVFPHWFNDEFVKFGDQVDRLPFDQHCVVALIAPRFLLDTEGAQDAWANFPRSLDSLKAADPVFKLLGAKGIQGSGLVRDDEPIVGRNFGSIMQYRLNEKHTLNAVYWNKILDFADASFKK